MSKQLTVFRNEKKYLIPQDVALRLQEEIGKLLEPDPHSADGYYIVRSLYFDSLNDMDFRQKDAGDRYRKKVRLRVYSVEDETAKLELKAKDGNLQHKMSLVLTREEAALLQDGEYEFLIDKGDELSLKLYKIMTLGIYRPAALIEYDRRAFVYPEFNTRITFDTMVRSSEVDLDVFTKEPAWNSVLSDATVLEVKYDEKLFKPISKLLRKYNIVNSSYSKYGSGRVIMEKYL